MSDRLAIFHDNSGLITVGVFSQTSPGRQQIFEDHAANVPSDMVVIGGGAIARWNGEGALLTASYPNSELSAWLGSSKDHGIPDPHILTTFAIGLRINGLTRSQLRDSIHLVTEESGRGDHPEATALLPNDFVLVGGGAKVEWSGEGNLLTASFPATQQSWRARSKDHGKPSPANLRAYALGLSRRLPVGEVIVDISTGGSQVSNHPAALADVSAGFALVGGGADVHWKGEGNMLWRLEPIVSTTDQGFAASGKDHTLASPSSLTVYSIGIQIRR